MPFVFRITIDSILNTHLFSLLTWLALWFPPLCSVYCLYVSMIPIHAKRFLFSSSKRQFLTHSQYQMTPQILLYSIWFCQIHLLIRCLSPPLLVSPVLFATSFRRLAVCRLTSYLSIRQNHRQTMTSSTE